MTIAVVAAGCLVLAFAAGMWTARSPSAVVDEQATQVATEATTTTREVVEETSTTATTDSAEADVRIVYRDRWYRADGSLEREREVDAKAAAAQLREQVQADARREEQEARVEVRTEVVEVERLVRVESDPPRWLVGGAVLIDDRGIAAAGPQVHRRVFGPVHLSGAVLVGRTTAGMVGITVGF